MRRIALAVLVLLAFGPGPVLSDMSAKQHTRADRLNSANRQTPAAPPGPQTLPDTGDRHAGYYYPPITSRETYPARAPMLSDSDRQRRLGFIVGLTRQQIDRAYPPQYAIFAKGEEAEKLIIVALDRNSLASLYQARGLLAQMTALARATPIFVENQVEDHYTFLDLLRLLGFEQVTISDGMTYAHQIAIE